MALTDEKVQSYGTEPPKGLRYVGKVTKYKVRIGKQSLIDYKRYLTDKFKNKDCQFLVKLYQMKPGREITKRKQTTGCMSF